MVDDTDLVLFCILIAANILLVITYENFIVQNLKYLSELMSFDRGSLPLTRFGDISIHFSTG